MPWWLPAAISAGGAIAGYVAGKKNQTPGFAGSEYGQYLSKLKEEGSIGDREAGIIKSRVGRDVGQATQQAVASTRGELEARNFGDSIAGVATLQKPYQEYARQLRGVSENIELENEQTKRDAGSQYYQTLWGNRLQRTAEKRQNVSNLIGGLTSAGVAGATAFNEKPSALGKAVNDLDPEVLKNMSREQLEQYLRAVLNGEG